MGNPVRFGLPQLFSENPIREILTDPLQKCNPYPSFIQITLIRDFYYLYFFIMGFLFYPFHKIRAFIITLMLYFSLIILYWYSRFFYPLCFITLGFPFFLFVCCFGGLLQERPKIFFIPGLYY